MWMLEATVPWWEMMVACIAIGIISGIIKRAREDTAYYRGYNDGVNAGMHMNDDDEEDTK